MNERKNLIAIGRSKYLFDAIRHLISKGYSFKAIVTEQAYEEYDVKSDHFEELAESIGAAFFLTKRLDDEGLINIIKENNVRVAISANWMFTISKRFLDLFDCGILNFHLGNLPDYKGNATVNWSIINGEKHIYANIHKMDPSLDAGDVVVRKSIAITPETYIADIIAVAEKLAPALYEEALAKIINDPLAYEQKGSTSGLRCFPRRPEDSQIYWNLGVDNISKLIRASSYPYQGAYTFLDGKKVTIWRARPYEVEESVVAVPGHVVKVNKGNESIVVACKDGLLEVQEIEYNGTKTTPISLIRSIRARFKFLANA